MERIMLRIAEAAEVLGFARSTMYKLIREKAIPSCLVGSSIRIPVPALQEWAREKGLEFALPISRRKYSPQRGQAKGVR